VGATPEVMISYFVIIALFLFIDVTTGSAKSIASNNMPNVKLFLLAQLLHHAVLDPLQSRIQTSCLTPHTPHSWIKVRWSGRSLFLNSQHFKVPFASSRNNSPTSFDCCQGPRVTLTLIDLYRLALSVKSAWRR
jgi:hypothetical protein